MKVNLGKKVLIIGFHASIAPNLPRLQKELADFFRNNEIEGNRIKEFRLDQTLSRQFYEIVPIDPPIEENLSGGDYYDKIKQIGKKYGIKRLGFAYWCYHK